MFCVVAPKALFGVMYGRCGIRTKNTTAAAQGQGCGLELRLPLKLVLGDEVPAQLVDHEQVSTRHQAPKGAAQPKAREPPDG